jgi:4-methyl-5(b-hydroxyethyl)-thiazole monophosphate biosynthesis
MKRIACLLADGFEETEALQTVDIFRRANLEVDMISINDKIVTGSHNIQVVADMLLPDSLSKYDMIFLPGGQPGTNHLMANQKVIDEIRLFHHEEKWLAAICAAPLVFDLAGVIKGKKVTSHPGAKEGAFKDSIYLEREVVIDGHIITSRGVGTVPAFAFSIIELFGIDSKPLQESMVFSTYHQMP